MSLQKYADIYGEVANHFSRDQRERVKLWVNEAERDLVNKELWWWTLATGVLATAAGTREYSLAGTTLAGAYVPHTTLPDLRNILDVRWEGTGRKLKEADVELMDELTDGSTVSDVPRLWSVSANAAVITAASIVPGGAKQLTIYPAALSTAGLRIRFWRGRSTAMAADTDLPLVPVDDVDAIVYRALELGYAYVDQVGQSGKFGELYATKVKEMATANAKVQGNSLGVAYGRVPGSPQLQAA